MSTKWAILILFLAGIAAYGNTVRNRLFWDDDEFITKNAYIRSFRYLPQWLSQPLTAGAGVNSNYYRPLLQLSFAIDYKLWGLWPAGYHLENILWHTAAGIMLFVFLTEFLRNSRFQISDLKFVIMVSLTTALAWLVHPVHVEAVAYANSRGDSMATVFILLTLILWMKKRFWASAAAFLAALLSKEFAIVAPGLIILIEIAKNFKSNSKNQLSKSKFLKIGNWSLKIGIFIAIAAIYVILRLTVLNFQNTLNFYGVDLAKADQAQPLARYATSLPVRLMTFMKVLPIYAKILVWPNDLHVERTVEIPISFSDPTTLSAIGLSVLIGLLVYWLLTKHKQYLPMFVSAWFFISILPVSGIIPISQILAEHFLYLPSIGFFLITSWFIVAGISKVIKTARWRRATLLIVFCSLLIPLLLKTIRQNRIWRDPITFYEYTLSRTTPTARVYNNLAMAYADSGNHEKAISNYQLAIGLGDVYPNPHYNLGNTLIELGRTEEAEQEYKRALEIDQSFHYATLKLGQMCIDQGKIDDAKKIVCPVFPAQPLCR